MSEKIRNIPIGDIAEESKRAAEYYFGLANAFTGPLNVASNLELGLRALEASGKPIEAIGLKRSDMIAITRKTKCSFFASREEKEEVSKITRRIQSLLPQGK
jgi:hypothetical protein